MDDTPFVRRLERLGDLQHDGDGVFDRHGPASEAISEILAWG